MSSASERLPLSPLLVRVRQTSGVARPCEERERPFPPSTIFLRPHSADPRIACVPSLLVQACKLEMGSDMTHGIKPKDKSERPSSVPPTKAVIGEISVDAFQAKPESAKINPGKSTMRDVEGWVARLPGQATALFDPARLGFPRDNISTKQSRRTTLWRSI